MFTQQNPPSPEDGPRPAGMKAYLLALLICSATAFAVKPLASYVDLANVAMIFLLAVFVVALLYGSGPALAAAFLSVGMFDFFFVQPHLSFAVDDLQYLITFAVMLTVALITGQLAARWRFQAAASRERERRARALYEMAGKLAGAITLEQVETITHTFLRDVAGMDANLHLPDAKGNLLDPDENTHLTGQDRALLERVFKRGEPAQKLGLSGRGRANMVLPLKTPMRIRGVLEVWADVDALSQERALLDTAASLTAIAVERLHYAEVAQAAEVKMEAERLRNSVLASLSHDLRTPLTAMVGLSGTLLLGEDKLPAAQRDTVHILHDQSVELAGMVDNLLDLASLISGGMTLRKEWQPLEEVVGAAIKRLGPVLNEHPLTVDLPADLPLLRFDAVLLERVIGNLLDNVCKHAPTGTPVSITAGVEGRLAYVDILDQGPGFPPGLDLNAALLSGGADFGRSGIGLGLTICKGIVEAHQGELTLSNRTDGPGGRARFTLPLGTPPIIEEEPAEGAA